MSEPTRAWIVVFLAVFTVVAICVSGLVHQPNQIVVTWERLQ